MYKALFVGEGGERETTGLEPSRAAHTVFAGDGGGVQSARGSPRSRSKERGSRCTAANKIGIVRHASSRDCLKYAWI